MTDLTAIPDAELAEQIEAAKARSERLRSEANAADRDLRALGVEQASRAFGVRSGTVIVYRYGNGERRGVVQEVSPLRWSGSRPILLVKPILKTGALGESVTVDWQPWRVEVPDAAE